MGLGLYGFRVTWVWARVRTYGIFILGSKLGLYPHGPSTESSNILHLPPSTLLRCYYPKPRHLTLRPFGPSRFGLEARESSHEGEHQGVSPLGCAKTLNHVHTCLIRHTTARPRRRYKSIPKCHPVKPSKADTTCDVPLLRAGSSVLAFRWLLAWG